MSLSSWTTEWPSSTTLRSIDSSNYPNLASTLSSALANAATQTAPNSFVSLSKDIRGAQASLAIISAQSVLATATEDAVMAQATEDIFHNTVNLHALYNDEDLYNEYLSRPANIIYLALFFLITVYLTGMLYKSRYHWFNVAFICGYILEFLGFLGRVLSFTDFTNFNYFLLQFVSLTLAPAFIMGGVYFTFAQLVVVYGRKYSILSPMWYSYIFISFDAISLIVQAIGGAMASSQSSNHEDNSSGTNVMIAGIAFQVGAMSIFLCFWFEFLNRLYFKNSKIINVDSPVNKRSFANFFKFLFNSNEANFFSHTELEKYYTPDFADLRKRKLLPWFPLAITTGTLLIYIRCVYRVVELAQGWDGYLMNHEIFLMTLDALMIGLAGLVFCFFHPVWVFGPENRLRAKHVRHHSKKGKEVTRHILDEESEKRSHDDAFELN